MIGAMRDRVEAYTLTKVSNGRGGWTHQETLLGTFWAKIEDLNARNIVQFRQGDLNTNTQITMRANPSITRESVFYARGKKYLIEEILEVKGYYTILAVGEHIGKQ